MKYKLASKPKNKKLQITLWHSTWGNVFYFVSYFAPVLKLIVGCLLTELRPAKLFLNKEPSCLWIEHQLLGLPALPSCGNVHRCMVIFKKNDAVSKHQHILYLQVLTWQKKWCWQAQDYMEIQWRQMLKLEFQSKWSKSDDRWRSW